MANFKRKKSKRQVRCTMCTPVRWLGNSKERVKAKERYEKKPLATCGTRGIMVGWGRN